MNRILKYLVLFFLGSLAIYSCQNCDDCGPSRREPYVNLRFFNIDSLIKVQDTLVFLQDSLDVIDEAIDAGDTTLSEEKTSIENSIESYQQAENDINQGKIRIDEVYGPSGEGPLLFRDSLTNDTLTVFRFPLDMNSDESTFIIKIREDLNDIGFTYNREIDKGDHLIVMRIYDLMLKEHSFDSVRLICGKSKCTSNETTIRIYF